MYQDHRVKVTEAKKSVGVFHLRLVCLQLKGNLVNTAAEPGK